MSASRQVRIASVDSPTEGGSDWTTRQHVELIVGDYEEKGKSHGRPYFCKTQSSGEPVWLYFWDSRGRPGQSGWYFGKQVDSETVWAMSASTEQTPPTGGWKVPWDATIAADHLQVHLLVKLGNFIGGYSGQCVKQGIPNNKQPLGVKQQLHNGAFGVQSIPSGGSHRSGNYQRIGAGDETWVGDPMDLSATAVPSAFTGPSPPAPLSKTLLAAPPKKETAGLMPASKLIVPKFQPYQASPRQRREPQSTAAGVVRNHIAKLETANEGNFMALAVELDTVFAEQAPNLTNETTAVTLELEKALKEVGERVGLTYYWEPPTVTQKRKQQDRQKDASARQNHMACLGVKKSIQRMKGASTRAEVEQVYVELAEQFIANLDNMGRQAKTVQQEVESALAEVNAKFDLTLDCPF